MLAASMEGNICFLVVCGRGLFVANLAWRRSSRWLFLLCMLPSEAAMDTFGQRESKLNRLALLIIAVSVFFIVRCLEKIRCSEAQATLQMRQSNQDVSITQKPLSAMSDAVIQEPSPSLTRLLLMHDQQSTGLQHRSFLDILVGDDQDRFRVAAAQAQR
eukprot:gnl/TRDRNA2_/TRDRNA2_144098_c0_seq1.p3 gnl/TRDRNA2_/TRDRNA2_144098_c0~~gnl/TRDRNA2_/TRDRNA2_144098_c0_seq1.p3  ORF type:complete len:159 (+),score=18.60 gnl/TRDRNA2_/TRDRNA2_144098_c0_seq1:516-992(+)